MRVFSIIGLLVSVLIIGWLSSMYLSSMGGAVQSRPAVESGAAGVSNAASAASSGAEVSPASPVERAQGLADADRERQRNMQSLLEP